MFHNDDRGDRAKDNKTLLRSASLTCLSLLASLAVFCGTAQANDTQHDDFIPLPKGTSSILGYYILQDFDAYHPHGGQPITNDTHAQAQVGIIRLAHYTTIRDMPVLLNAFQTFGRYSALKVAGSQLPRQSTDLGNLTLGAFIWPVHDATKRQFLAVGGYVSISDGKWNASKATLTDNRTSWTPQVAFIQSVSKTIDLQVVADTTFYGKNSQATPAGNILRQDNSFQAQLWGTYHVVPLTDLALGYTRVWGGASRVDATPTLNKTDRSQIRASASHFFAAQKFQLQVEASHDLAVDGGFKRDFGLLVRIARPF